MLVVQYTLSVVGCFMFGLCAFVIDELIVMSLAVDYL